MKTYSAAIALLLALLAPQARADVPEAYPGSLWGVGTHDLNGIEGTGTQGNLSQGVQWTTLPGDIPFQTFGAYSWRFRTDNNQYFNAHGPELGVKFSKWFFDFGTYYEWYYYPGLQTRTEDWVVFLDWYKRFDLFSGDASPSLLGLPVLGFPTTTWGKVWNDFHNLEGVGTQGFVSQAIEWVRLPADIVFRTFAVYRWRVRTLNTDYYNQHGPGLGIEFGHSPLDLGLEYDWQNYTSLHTTTNAFQAYLTWYFDWDLKKLGSH